MLHTSYLSLGSNLGHREANLKAAIERLKGFGDVKRISPFYETEPVEVTDQPWFVNCAVEIETELTARQLLEAGLSIERELGRVRAQPKGPRVIDIDLLFFDLAVLDETGLKVPHPAMQDRRFVLRPLADIAAEVVHPLLKRSVADLLLELPNGDEVRKL